MMIILILTHPTNTNNAHVAPRREVGPAVPAEAQGVDLDKYNL